MSDLIERLREDAEWNSAPQLNDPTILKTAALELEAAKRITELEDQLATQKAAAQVMTSKKVAELDRALSDATEAQQVLGLKLAQVEAERDRYISALNWALGCGDEFPGRAIGQGAYYWRAELAGRAELEYNGTEYAAKEQQ